MTQIELNNLHIITHINQDGWSTSLCGLYIDADYDNFIKINNKLCLSLSDDTTDICSRCIDELNKQQYK